MPHRIILASLLALCAQLPAAESVAANGRAPMVAIADAFFDSSGARIHYVDAGKGAPLILLHGRGDSVQNWIDNGVMAALARDFRVIAMDFRGHGKSEKLRDPKQYGREMGLDVVRLLDHLGIRRAHVVSYSMGAAITAQLLTTHERRFLTATLGAGAPRLGWTDADTDYFEKGATETESYGFSPTTRHASMAAGTARMTASEIETESVKWIANPNHDRFAMAALMRSFRDQVVSSDEFAKVRIPVMGLVGGNDPQLANLKKMKDLLPQMKLVVIEGGTHTGLRDSRKSPEFATAIRDFIAGSAVITAANDDARKARKASPARLTNVAVRSEARVYRQTPQGELKVHLFFPPDWAAHQKRPAMVLVFGGGFITGSPDGLFPKAEYFASRGMICAAIEYRTERQHNAKPVDAMHDAKAAIRWMRENSVPLGIAPDKIAALGSSSGARMVAIIATTDFFDEPGADHTVSSKPSALVLLNPGLVVGPKTASEWGATLADQLSPMKQLSRKSPPTIMFFGTSDPLKASGDDYFARAKEIGIPFSYFTANGAGHSFSDSEPFASTVAVQVDRFLASLGFLVGGPTIEAKAVLQEVK